MTTCRPPPFSTTRHPPSPTLFPYTTLFRSWQAEAQARHERVVQLRMRFLDRLHATAAPVVLNGPIRGGIPDRKSTRLNSSHRCISYAVFCLKKKKTK